MKIGFLEPCIYLQRYINIFYKKRERMHTYFKIYEIVIFLPVCGILDLIKYDTSIL